MYKIFFTLLCFFVLSITTQAQTFQGTIKPGSTATSVIVAIKPSADYSDKPSNVQFTLAIPQVVGARPAMSIMTNNYSALFTTVALFQNATFGTDYIYLINMITPTLTTTKNSVANSEDVVAEIAFTGNVGDLSAIKLVQLPNGTVTTGAGSENGNYNYYIEFAAGSDKTNQAAMFYSNTGGIVVNNALGYGGFSSVNAGTTPLPLSWLGFNVQKQNNSALINWQIANQINNDYFEVQAGVDANNLSTIGMVPATSVNSYNFTHVNYTSLPGSKVYYRIKQVDKDGKFTYSKVLKLNLDSKTFAFKVIGNPIQGNNLNIAIESATFNKGSLTIFDLQGKKISQQNISWFAGTSQRLITLPNLAKGMYSAILHVDDKLYSLKFTR
ncbi:MAG: T9SS type A sorting domain-containing protein [Chitinophagaceae bacterium]|nr:T9SS type A sorting domain-containing protein [Chitinophagaceae bacterium]